MTSLPQLEVFSISNEGLYFCIEIGKKLTKYLLRRLVTHIERVRFWAIDPGNSAYLFRELQKVATADTVDFILKNLADKCFYWNASKLLEDSIETIPEGLVMEFGVFQGNSINKIAKLMPKETIYGFDSFEGLPSQWYGLSNSKSAFNLAGHMPKVESNVELIKGWFNETIPDFAEQNNQKISFIHIDCDLYSSTKIILDKFEKFFQVGSTIVFDEYFNYPGWRMHEYLAFDEFIKKTGFRFEYLGYSDRQVAVRIVNI
ncbi:class I SAM-dependent methyltransferase [Polynucleobacter sp. CS-Odin-A6]|uniref:class I SAM-dependent methyltransferase n=1 Tax=Polynucleobacter sp. CS-Odin-A6 TaxID=2689106 RepID=UPI001C0B87E5|nr:class I SAM-dependent methyltransferase [Polynucleobacter sp. CS-Odin-A6]MBU3621121.1 class I SAM-dependent methyltransferase [Polynucleobacter sp. CS-Odin-A6]